MNKNEMGLNMTDQVQIDDIDNEDNSNETEDQEKSLDEALDNGGMSEYQNHDTKNESLLDFGHDPDYDEDIDSDNYDD